MSCGGLRRGEGASRVHDQENRQAFIDGYLEANGRPENLDKYLAILGFEPEQRDLKTAEEAPRADYDDSPDEVEP